MKIVYAGAFRLPNEDAAAARVLNNAKAFAKTDHEVFVIGWGGKYREEDLCEDRTYKVDGIEYYITNELESSGFIGKVKSYLRRGRATTRILESMNRQPDVIILYNATDGWTKRMLRYCEKHHIYLVNDITEWYDNKELYFFQRLHNWINMTRTQHHVKNKILISSYLGEYYSESNNVIIPPLCDQKDKKWNNEICDDRVKPYNGITLIYAGTPARKDCLHTVINVVNQLAYEGRPIRFLILGCDRQTYLNDFKSYFKETDLHENILFLGRVSQDLVPAYYKKADFMVLLREPTRKSMAGFPTKVAEAITAGVPVITNNTSDLAQYIQDGQNGFILNYHDGEALYQLLSNRILGLAESQIQTIKLQTRETSRLFQYEKYISDFNTFLGNLR